MRRPGSTANAVRCACRLRPSGVPRPQNPPKSRSRSLTLPRTGLQDPQHLSVRTTMPPGPGSPAGPRHCGVAGDTTELGVLRIDRVHANAVAGLSRRRGSGRRTGVAAWRPRPPRNAGGASCGWRIVRSRSSGSRLRARTPARRWSPVPATAPARNVQARLDCVPAVGPRRACLRKVRLPQDVVHSDVRAKIDPRAIETARQVALPTEQLRGSDFTWLEVQPLPFELMVGQLQLVRAPAQRALGENHLRRGWRTRMCE